MFSIKICGITNVDDALMVAQAGADAIGLNFYPKSPRHVGAEVAREILAAVPRRIVKVGLFVNAPREEVCKAFDELGLDLIQLHGDETPAWLAELGGRPAMKVFRVGPNGLPPIAQYLDECRRRACLPRFVLFDALVAGVYGGTGRQADWPTARRYQTQVQSPTLVLAGGLTPQNVSTAISATGARAIDTSSGVESSPGRKDAGAVAALVAAAHEAFSAGR